MAELKKERIPYDENLELGVMIETPAAVMIAPELAREVSFFSIGTNDLTQYTIALDRQSICGLEKFYDAKHPAVLRMIKMTVDAAHEAGICGELAADSSLLLYNLLPLGRGRGQRFDLFPRIPYFHHLHVEEAFSEWKSDRRCVR